MKLWPSMMIMSIALCCSLSSGKQVGTFDWGPLSSRQSATSYLDASYDVTNPPQPLPTDPDEDDAMYKDIDTNAAEDRFRLEPVFPALTGIPSSSLVSGLDCSAEGSYDNGNRINDRFELYGEVVRAACVDSGQGEWI